MVDLTQLEFKNIIVRMPNWVGDLVMALPILTDLRKAFPAARLTAMCRHPMGELLQEFPDVDEVFSFTKTSRLIHRDEKKNIMQKLQAGQYDLGVLLPNTVSSAWWFWQGGVTYRIGFDCAGRKVLLTHPVPYPTEDVGKKHLITIYKKVLAPLGLPISDTKPKLYLREEEVEHMRVILSRHGVRAHHKIIGINPGAAYGSAKCWLPERFRAVTTELLQDKEVIVVFFGDLTTAQLVKEICQGLSPRVINMAGLTSLRELASLISLCRVLLTNDSGPMHIAGAFDTPVVALFGSTSAIATGPWHRGVVLRKQVSCSPCYKRVCPIDFRCMRQIQVQEVTDAIRGVLESQATKLSVLP
ncbi:MAG: lipopolysaccharide heptosyltransferase II [Chlamydiae bacterium]|nr:lipopolysaccharide heptosyltransferase II [Chlamydiota bacterium]